MPPADLAQSLLFAMPSEEETPAPVLPTRAPRASRPEKPEKSEKPERTPKPAKEPAMAEAAPLFAEARDGDVVEGVFALVRAQVRATSGGKPYLDLELADASGRFSAKAWDAGEAKAKELSGEFVTVAGTVESYRGKKQLNLRRIAAYDGPVEAGRFLPHTPFDTGELLAKLRAHHAKIRCPHLRALIDAFLDDPALRERFCRAPAAVTNHHAYVGGLLEHVLSLTEACVRMAEVYAGVIDKDLLVAGAFFHDIGKLEELSIGSRLDYADEGRLLGHITQGAFLVRDAARRLPDFPKATLDQLLHLILSHHGTLEWGSPVRPQTAEAVLLHYLDNVDAKLWALERAVTGSKDDGRSGFTEYVQVLETRAYKHGLGMQERGDAGR